MERILLLFSLSSLQCFFFSLWLIQRSFLALSVIFFFLHVLSFDSRHISFLSKNGKKVRELSPLCIMNNFPFSRWLEFYNTSSSHRSFFILSLSNTLLYSLPLHRTINSWSRENHLTNRYYFLNMNNNIKYFWTIHVKKMNSSLKKSNMDYLLKSGSQREQNICNWIIVVSPLDSDHWSFECHSEKRITDRSIGRNKKRIGRL